MADEETLRRLREALDLENQTLERRAESLQKLKDQAEQLRQNAAEAEAMARSRFEVELRAEQAAKSAFQVKVDELKLLQQASLAGREQLQDLLAANPALEARYQILGRSLETVTDELESLERIQELGNEREKQLTDQNNKYKDLQKIVKNLADERTRSLQAEVLAAKAREAADKQATDALQFGLRRAIELFFEIDKAASDFNRRFRFGTQYAEDMRDLAGSMYIYGASAQDVLRVQGELINNFTDFVKLSGAQQQSITESVVLFDKLGVTSADSTKILQMGTKAFGLSADELAPKMRGLAANASALQMDQTQYFATLANSGPLLAKFGSDFDITFKRLQHTLRVTGLEMEKVLGITNQFDTFEGAATQAGKLNAALGGNFVNAMDLMMATDPVERFEMIRDSILDAGLSFENMSYYQRLFYTESLGLNDVNELSLLLSGNMNEFSNAINANAESLEEQQKAAKLVMSVQDKLNAIINENAEALVPLGDVVLNIANFLILNADSLELVIKGFIAYKAMIVTNTVLTMAFGTALGFATGGLSVLAGIAAYAAASLTIFKEEGLVSKSPSELVLRVNELGEALYFAAGAMKAAGSVAIDLTRNFRDLFLAGGGVGDIAKNFASFAAGSASLMLLVPAITGIGAALRTLPIEKLNGFSALTTAMVELTKMPEKLSVVASEIERIADAIGKIPETRVMAVKAMMETTTTAVAAATTTPAITATNTQPTANQPINFYLDKDLVGKAVLDIVGGEVRRVRQQV